jgi:hypothetical protein
VILNKNLLGPRSITRSGLTNYTRTLDTLD